MAPENKLNSNQFVEKPYKQSKWVNLIDTTLGFAEVSGISKFANWARWMQSEGFQLSDKDVIRKTNELVGISEDDERTTLQNLSEDIRLERNPVNDL